MFLTDVWWLDRAHPLSKMWNSATPVCVGTPWLISLHLAKIMDMPSTTAYIFQ